MVAADLDGDGSVELAVAAESFWYVLEPHGAGYVHRWTSLPYQEAVDRLVVAQVDGDLPLEVVVSVGGRLLLHDGASFALEGELVTAADRASGLAVANLDGDPALEAVLCTELAPGSTTSRPAPSSSPCPPTRAPTSPPARPTVPRGSRWRSPTARNRGWSSTAPPGAWSGLTLGSGDLVALGDLDGDLREEIAAGFAGTASRCRHGDTHGYFWGLSNAEVNALTIADVVTAPPELLFGDGQWGRLHVLEGATGGERWSVDNPEHGVSRIAVGDVDGDTVREVVFGAGSASRLHVLASDTQVLEWVSDDHVGPFSGLAHGDVDADGDPELVFTTSASDGGYGDGLYLVYDAVARSSSTRAPRPPARTGSGPGACRSRTSTPIPSSRSSSPPATSTKAR